MGATILATAAIALPQIASAQEVAPEQEETAQSGDLGADAIVVTGSRIARPNLASTNPITTVTVDEIITGDISLGNALQNLPQLGQTFTSANSTRFIGTAGLSILDLRNLGTERTVGVMSRRSPDRTLST
jgi:hypothetical protein